MLSIIFMILALPLMAFGQLAPPESQSGNPKVDANNEDGIGVAPARFELPMLPGTERTLVVNIIYNSVSQTAQPCRLVVSLGDWGILEDGNIDFFKAGTQPNSAAPWIVYSPGEVTAVPGKVHPVRVTISVPKDATPGDHLAALFVESRPENIKLTENKKQVILRFRMAALFYIMVPNLTRKGSLENLKTEADGKEIIITPTIKNDGNSHIRPMYWLKVIDPKGEIVAALPETESLPVLAGLSLSRPIVIEKAVAPGAYTVFYRVDFKDGGAVVEGQTDLLVREQPAKKGVDKVGSNN
jgi:hypothetical protein